MRPYQTHSNHRNLPFGSATKQQVLFRVEIKINNKKKNLEVYADDTHSSLAHRFCQTNGLNIDRDYIAAVQQKILKFLQGILSGPSCDTNLKEKISQFVSKRTYKSKQKDVLTVNYAQKKRQEKQKMERNPIVTVSGQKYTPFKLIQNDSVNVSTRKSLPRKTEQERVNNNISINKQDSKKRSTKKAGKTNSSLGTFKPNYVPFKQNKIAKKDKKSYDQDLVQAYQVIYQKSKESHMKSMAKKFLKQNGFISHNSQSIHATNRLTSKDKANPSSHEKQKAKQSKEEQQNLLKAKTIEENIVHKIHNFDQNTSDKKSSQNKNSIQGKKQKFTYLQEIQGDAQLLRNPILEEDVSQFQVNRNGDFILESSIIHGLDRSRSRSRQKVRYNVDFYDNMNKFESRGLRRRAESLSYDRLFVPHEIKRLQGYEIGKRSKEIKPISSFGKKYNYLEE